VGYSGMTNSQYQLLAGILIDFYIGYWLLAIGYWLLAIGYWLLAIGYWLSAIGYQLLAIWL
jgi:predicted tellurium resistance membrane protein TerC